MPAARGRKALLLGLLSAGIWSGAGVLLAATHWLESTRLFWLDQLFVARQRLGCAPKPHPDVVIVGVDERSRDAFRRRLGGSVEDRRVFRHIVGRLLVKLSRAGAKVAAVDFLFDRPLGGEVDEYLVNALAGGERVQSDGIDAVLACHITVAEEKRPFRALHGLADEGNVAILADPDGVYRRVRPAMVATRPDLTPGAGTSGDAPASVNIPLFAFQACRLFVGSTDNEYGSARLTEWRWHNGAGEDGSIEVHGRFRVPAEMLIDFVGPAQQFEMDGRQFSAVDVLDGRVPGDKFRGKLVLIGPALRSADRFAVPVTPSAAGEAYREFFEKKYGVDVSRVEEQGGRLDLLRSGAMSGIEIHANVASQILDGRYLHEVRAEQPWLKPAAICLVVVGLGWTFWQDPRAGKRRTVRGLIGSGVLFLAVLFGAAAASVLLFVHGRWVFVPLSLMAAWTGQAACGMTYTGVLLRRQNQRIETMFGSAVGEELLDYLNAHPELMTRNERRTATVLFCDIRGFTPLTESLDSDEVVALLRGHFEALWRALADEGAWVDKYVGDLVMAAWNVLQPIDDHALRGVRAAVAMKGARAALNEQRLSEGHPPVEIGIGLHTGELVGGNIGSRKRSNFTIIGDTVNLASRIEHEARGGEVLISEDTYRLVAGRVLAEPRPPVEIRGKTGKYTLYEVFALVDGPVVPGKQAQAEAARAERRRAAGEAAHQPPRQGA